MNPVVLGDRFNVGELLGQGGMGVVYHGVDRQTGLPVAIKTLHGDVGGDAEETALDRFKREAELLRQLNHPNIVKVLSTIEQDYALWIVMEYIDAGSLAARIKHQHPLPLARVLSIALDVADAMTRVHRLGILHRDLKPENVLLGSDGGARLSDFGIAHLAGRQNLTLDAGIQGTPQYLSPEALSGEPLDTRSDVWAFGAVLFEMIAGYPPFRADMMARLVMSIMTDPVPDLESIRPDAPVALVDLIYRMLEKDAGSRLRSVRIAGAELESMLQSIAPEEAVVAGSGGLWQGDQRVFASVPTTRRGTPNNLPSQTTPFIGRRSEMLELERLLPAARLLTIVGAGGSGKTRVAQELGASQLENFSDGVFFVALAPLREVDDIVTAIGDAVGLSFRPGVPRETELLGWLGDKKLLFILDNFEHLLNGGPKVSMMLDAAKRLTIVASSREPIGLPHETVFRLEGIDVPTVGVPAESLASFGAVELFLQRARRAWPAFKPDQEDMNAIATIGRVVGGSPLAIVLAASWVEMLRPREILLEIRQSLDFLDTTEAVDERHRSMRVVFDAAWQRLSADEQAQFAQMSVFRGGFTREAAQAITGASLRSLSHLLRHSLIHRDPATGRYDVHELLRQYAEGLAAAGGRDNAEARHSAWYGAFLESVDARISGADNRDALGEVEREIDNVRAAWDSAVNRGDFAVIGRSLNSLATYYMLRTMNEEALARFGPALELVRRLPDEVRPLPLELGLQVRWTGALMNLRGFGHPDVGAGFARAHELCDRIGPSAMLAPVMFGLWAFNVIGAEYATAGKLARQLLEIGESSGSPLLEIGGLHASTGSCVTAGELERGVGHARRVLELYKPEYDPQIIAWYADHSAAATRGWNAVALSAMGRIEEAKIVEQELIVFLERLSHGNTHSLGLLFVSLAVSIRGDIPASLDVLRELKSVAIRYGLPVYAMLAEAFISCWEATPEHMEQLGPSTGLIRDMFGFKAMTVYSTMLRQSELELAAGQPNLASATADRGLAWIRAQGEWLLEPEALRARGNADLASGDMDAAEANYLAAKEAARGMGARLFEVRSTIELAGLRKMQGRLAEARQVLQGIEGFITTDCADVRNAAQLLADLGPAS